MSYKISRRRFIEGTAGAVGLAAFAKSFEAFAQEPAELRRLLVIQRPVGTVYENWWPQGNGGTNYTPSRILMKFQEHRERMIVLRDLDLPSSGSVGGGHERGTVLMLTGTRTRSLYPGNGGDDPMAEGPSIDQLWVKDSALLKGPPIASLQLSCDNRADTPEVSTRHMSYSGARAPMKPYYQPRDAYERVFGTLMPGGMTPANMDALARAGARWRPRLRASSSTRTRPRSDSSRRSSTPSRPIRPAAASPKRPRRSTSARTRIAGRARTPATTRPRSATTSSTTRSRSCTFR